MAAWTQAVHLHPWFKMSSLKRPHSPSPDDSDSDTPFPSIPTLEPLHARKRRRSTALENGFARLSLTPPVVPLPQPLYNPPSPTPAQPSDAFMEFDDLPSLHHDAEPVYVTPDASTLVTLASSIEEPPEVQMRASSWYEPSKDRIIVTDLDASDDEDEGQGGSTSGVPSILPSALELLHTRVGQLPLPLREHEERARALALVPFQPSPFQALQGDAGQRDTLAVSEETESEPDSPPSRVSTPSDDAMDIEPMDVEV